ncbi:exopolygalacturonase-like [Diospyros lotus]|uniref:exopolygalacturonase-like n=1 Tax=Diospyros lotus TaxID=55363 RepID=UPI002259998A|nr:exopolygalacturonase-like [Diospyros lotus]
MLAFKVISLAVYAVVSLLIFLDVTASVDHIYRGAPEYPSPATQDDPSPELPGVNWAPDDDDDDERSRVFDVTGYGAVADGATETSSAFLAAWEDACAYNGNATLLVPNGAFFIGPVTLEGPCYNNQSPRISLRGTLKAPSSLNAFPTSSWIVFRGLQNFDLTGETGTATIDGQGMEAWALGSSDKIDKPRNRPTSMKFVNISGGTISSIALLNSKNFHMSFLHCKDIVVDGVEIRAPWDSPNTDGIHISSSCNINITNSTIGVGDDCVSIGPGNANILVLNVTCGPGHGISVGSLGKYPNEENVTGVLVKNCTIRGTQNGVRVKTWPGSPPSMASNLTFQDIVMINVSNPIIIDQEYCPSHTCLNFKPSDVKLSNIYFRNIKGTSRTKYGVTLVCSSNVACENVHFVDVKLNHTAEDCSLSETGLILKGALQDVEFLL